MQLMNLKRQITYCISLCIPKRKGRWTFGAWMGGRFSDNPKAFLDYMVKSHPEYEYSWVINDPDSIDKRGFENVTFLRRGSFSAWKRVVTSEYLIMSHGSRDFGKYNQFKEQFAGMSPEMKEQMMRMAKEQMMAKTEPT